MNYALNVVSFFDDGECRLPGRAFVDGGAVDAGLVWDGTDWGTDIYWGATEHPRESARCVFVQNGWMCYLIYMLAGLSGCPAGRLGGAEAGSRMRGLNGPSAMVGRVPLGMWMANRGEVLLPALRSAEAASGFGVYLFRLLRTFRAMAEAKMKASSSLLSVSRMSSLVPSHHLRPW